MTAAALILGRAARLWGGLSSKRNHRVMPMECHGVTAGTGWRAVRSRGGIQSPVPHLEFPP
jgi:hypothetical protein